MHSTSKRNGYSSLLGRFNETISKSKSPFDFPKIFYDYIRTSANKVDFELLVKSKLNKNDMIILINILTSLCIKPSEFRKNNIIRYVMFDEFVDSVVLYIKNLSGSGKNELVQEMKKNNRNDLLILVRFFEVMVQFLPICDVTYQKMAALVEMTLGCVLPTIIDENIGEIEERITEIIKLLDQKQSMFERNSLFYTDINIFPSQVELYEKRDMLPSIVHGPYRNSEEYLSIQFKLLKEDFIASIQEGLDCFRSKERVSGKRESSFWLYKNVVAKSFASTKSKICHKVYFSHADSVALKRENWETSKKFMSGSLLLFSLNNFNTFTVATIELNDCEFTLGRIIALTVSIVGNPHQLKLNKRYDMIEPRSFFQPYHHSLRILQSMNPYTFPLADEIVSVNFEVHPSPFIKRTSNSLPYRYEGNDLNMSQLKALNGALSEKFTLIQGPPGTGKSLMTRKIISILAEDTRDDRPILVVCMRNRALDIVLEPLAENGLRVVRVGRTKSEMLERYTLFNMIARRYRPRTSTQKFIQRALGKYRSKIFSQNPLRTSEEVEEAVRKYYHASHAAFTHGNYYDAHQLLANKVQVIGTTTTGAAKRNALINKMNPKAVIVEEASEVLESYVVTSLPLSCDHLILVGDHLQLPPISNLRDCNMEISLFERLINNGKNYYQLNVQHRMRPEIAELISPLIYPNLHNHPSVYEFPNVKGCVKNVYFLTHSISEEHNAESLSFSNTHEANFLLSLANYFVNQGYKCTDVTILAAYSAQQNYLIQNSNKYPLIKDMSIQTIDNYQGDENDIILMSLVRSNGKTIGFLHKANRINVALSRARHGLFIIGNMTTLKMESIWRQLSKILKKRNNLGTKLPLICRTHKFVNEVASPEEIDNLKLGGCMKLCSEKLACGHNCKSICHGSLDLHRTIVCEQPCLRKICNTHRCKKKCFEECGTCGLESVTLDCGHVVELDCSTRSNLDEYKCTLPCKRKPCSLHDCKRLCFEECPPCSVYSKFTLKCGHSASIVCSAVSTYKCTEPCRKKTCKIHRCKKKCYEKCGPCNKRSIELDCGHVVDLDCSTNLAALRCTFPCKRKTCNIHQCKKLCYQVCGTCDKKKIRLDCGHIVELDCSTSEIYKCTLPCIRKPCLFHECKKLCFEECSPCKVKSQFKLKCGHTATMECSALSTYKCTEPCGKLLPCGVHVCENSCHSSCPPCNKCKIIIVTLKCGHSQTVITSNGVIDPPPICTKSQFYTFPCCQQTSFISCQEAKNKPKKCNSCKNNDSTCNVM